MIALSLDDGVATVSLDRAAARNALPTAAWRMLARVVADIPDSARAVVVASRVPGIFSAGADLVDLARLADDVPARAAFRVAMAEAMDAIRAWPMPVVAWVDGGCFGAGVALALACDLIVASPAARFAIPPARLGIGYPAPDVARLARRVGEGQAARLLFTAAPIDADEAWRIGLADMIADGAQVARSIAQNDPGALHLLKRTLRDASAPGLDSAFEASFSSPAFAAGTAHYRRTP